MNVTSTKVLLDEILHSCQYFMSDEVLKNWVDNLLGFALNHTCSDLGCLYQYENIETGKASLNLAGKWGCWDVPRTFKGNSEFVEFFNDCGKAIVLLERRNSFFLEILLNKAMNSGILLPVYSHTKRIGALFLNSRLSCHYGEDRILFLENVIKIVASSIKIPPLAM